VVWDSETKTAESRRFRRQKSLVGEIVGFRERMERDRASIRLEHEVGSEDHGQMQHRESQKLATRHSRVGFQVLNLRERYLVFGPFCATTVETEQQFDTKPNSPRELEFKFPKSLLYCVL